MTVAPSSTKRSTHAAPIPDAAPVTNATLPSSRVMPGTLWQRDQVGAKVSAKKSKISPVASMAWLVNPNRSGGSTGPPGHV